MDFNEARDGRVAVASAGPYAPRSRQITMPAPHHTNFFTGCMLFLMSGQQCQSTEGIRKGNWPCKNLAALESRYQPVCLKMASKPMRM